jgi:iron(II)-dependent oxidoreductase
MPDTVVIPSGWFWMGSDDHYPWERPRHRVFLDAFEICTTTVTNREYSTFLQETSRPAPRDWRARHLSDPEQPVVGVSWFDAVEYCTWMSASAGALYRLPTEAEWERACRGELVDADYAWGDRPPEAFDYFLGEWPGPKPVAGSPPNTIGLFNMGENVHEWCLDWYAADYYASSPAHNPPGPETGTRRVSRGGSWRHRVKASRAAHRSSLPPEFQYTDYGFRLIRQGSGSDS